MSQLPRLLLRVFFGAEATASAYGFIQRLVEDEATMIGPWTFSNDVVETFYVFALALGVMGSLALSWQWISKSSFVTNKLSSKADALGELYDEIALRRDELIEVIDGTDKSESNLLYLAKTQELYTLLKKLKIPCPNKLPGTTVTAETKEGITEWCKFLIRLAAESRVRNIKGARALAKGSV